MLITVTSESCRVFLLAVNAHRESCKSDRNRLWRFVSGSLAVVHVFERIVEHGVERAFDQGVLDRRSKLCGQEKEDRHLDQTTKCDTLSFWMWKTVSASTAHKGLCEYMIIRTKFPPSPVMLCNELGGKPNWFPFWIQLWDTHRPHSISLLFVEKMELCLVVDEKSSENKSENVSTKTLHSWPLLCLLRLFSCRIGG